ncbi:MAG: amidohydrolase [Gemmatimonadetes bacterium]|nr:amidohydrolase [Gemmatimonadota bacterium]
MRDFMRDSIAPHRRIPVAIAVALTAVVAGCGGDAPSPTGEATTADLVLTNARVYTFDWAPPGPDGTPADGAPYDADTGWQADASAVAMRGNRIVYVGDDAGAAAFVGPETQTVDLDRAVVLPGLVDSHTHVAELGGNLSRIDLVGVETEGEAIARVVERATTVPAGEWILGAGWDEGAWADRYPTWDALDEAVPDHPVWLRGLHGFAGWGNRAAFEAAGIDPDTDDPVGGEIVRAPDGALTGLLLNRAVPLIDGVVPEPGPEQRERELLAALEEMARSGYVAVHEAGTAAATLAALEQLDAAGRLPLRFYAMLSGRDPALLAEWLERGPLTREGDPDPRLFVRSVKAYYDGSLGVRGARLLEDYADQPGHRGVSGAGYGFNQDSVALMLGAGFQVGIHAIGDAGNRETLDFLERVYAQSPSARAARNRVEHAQVVHPDDFARFADLDLVASMEPPHAVEDMPWAEDRLGPERVRGAYAWRTFLRAGVPLTFNADNPGSDHSPFYGLHAAVTRRDRELQPPGGWYPEQAVTPEEAVRAYTTGAAYASHLDERTGVLGEGRWADVTVLDTDPLRMGADAPAEAILRGRVLLTIVAGEVVYDGR